MSSTKKLPFCKSGVNANAIANASANVEANANANASCPLSDDDSLETVEEEIAEIKSVSRFDLSVLKDPRFLLYVLFVSVHAGGLVSVLVLQYTYLGHEKGYSSLGKTQQFQSINQSINKSINQSINQMVYFRLFASNQQHQQ